jgi:CO/xanthine dehydrogenase FAD-binding subunit
VVNITGLGGFHQVKLSEFFTGVKHTVLKRGELVVSVFLPDPGAGDKSTYLRQTRLKGHDLATVGVACRIKSDGKVALAICAVAPTPLRLFALEDQFNQRGLSEETILWAAEEIKQHIRPITDVRSSAVYRMQIASVLLKHGLLNLLGKEG